jgi:hypothetical protein
MKTSKSTKLIILGLSLILLVSVLLLSPAIRELIIVFAERFIVHRSLTHLPWHKRLLRLAYFGVNFGIVLALGYFIQCSAIVRVKIIDLKNKIASNNTISHTMIVLILGVVIVLFAGKSISNPNFWFDESGQFWMAKGLNHFSLPLSATGNIGDVLSNNARYNLDPGGFTVLLHFLTFIGNSPVILRLLPFAFFILSFILIDKICLIWFPNRKLCWFCGLALFLSGSICYYAFELRPYSMEMCTAFLSLFSAYKRDKILNNKKYGCFVGLLLAIGITSRYSAVFSVMPLFLIILYDIIRRYKLKKDFLNLLVFIVPLVVFSVGIIYFTLQFQNPQLNPPDYTKSLMFKTAGIHSILGKKTVYILPFIALFVLYILHHNKSWFKKYNTFVVFALLQNGIFIILSLLGKYTWGITSRWDIATHSLFIFSIIPLCFILLEKIKEFPVIKYYLIICAIVILSIFGVNFKYHGNDSIYDNYITSNVDSESFILANKNAGTTIRYLFEYGNLKNKLHHYPEQFFYFDETNGIIFDFQNNVIGNMNENVEIFDYIILTHFDKSDLDNIDGIKTWNDCASVGPSLMFNKKGLENE